MTEQVLSNSMLVPESAPDAQLYFPNLNLPEDFIATAGVAAHRRVLEVLNEGEAPRLRYEITPTRRLDWDSWLGKFDPQQDEPFAGRVHQTWAKGMRGVLGARSMSSLLRNIGVYLIMPETRSSLATIQRMSRQLGGAPAVVYSEGGRLVDVNNYDFMAAVQISPEEMIATGALRPNRYNYLSFHNSIWERGIRGVIVDGHHLVRRADADSALHLEWQKVLGDVEQTGTNVLGAHASAGRIDSKHEVDRRRSQDELAAIFKGAGAIGKTVMGEVLTQSYTIWRNQRASPALPESRFRTAINHPHIMPDPIEAQFWKESDFRRSEAYGRLGAFPVTIEVPYKGMAAYRGAERRLRMAELVSMHRDVAQSLAEFFQGVRAEYDNSQAVR